MRKLLEHTTKFDMATITWKAWPRPDKRHGDEERKMHEQRVWLALSEELASVNGLRQVAAKAARNAVRQTATQRKLAAQWRSRENYHKKVADAKGKAAPPLDCKPGRCVCPTNCSCEHSPAGKLKEGSDAAEKLATRFHASTNVVFSMELPDDVLRERIETCMRVSDEHKARLATEWSSKRAAHGMPMPACASCGIRDPQLGYQRARVLDLPPVFKLDGVEDTGQRARRERLGAVQLAEAPAKGAAPGTLPTFQPVDLRPIMSCWWGGWPCCAGPDDELYHLHPELVDKGTDGPTVLLCEHCHAETSKGADAKAPKLSIANGIDFGLLSRIPQLEPLSDVEQMLLSEVRLYHLVVKVSACHACRGRLCLTLPPDRNLSGDV